MPVRVLVAEDSLTVRRYLIDVLQKDPALTVVGEAVSGEQAVAMCQSLRPDVVTLDMIMPGMGGLEATEYIMAHCPTPIVIVSASNNRGDLVQTLDAVRAGAVEAVDKPLVSDHSEAWESKLRSVVKVAARIKVITHPRGKSTQFGQSHASTPLPLATHGAQAPKIVAIGTSTGGPPALMQILHALPATYPLPIVVVIHLSEAFGAAFTEWLGKQTALPVAYPTHGQALLKGPHVWVAPPNYHMTIQRGHFYLNQEPERHACRPSVDVLFESVAQEYGSAAAGVLLTGMGKDGAAGLLQMRQAGALTMAQDEASSVVYGMPREAMMLGAAREVVPLDHVAPALLALALRTRQQP